MEALYSYIGGLIAISLAAGMLRLTVGEGNRTAPYLRFISGLVAVTAIFLPLGELAVSVTKMAEDAVNAVSEIKIPDNSVPGDAELLLDETALRLSRTLEADCEARFDCEVSIRVEFDRTRTDAVKLKHLYFYAPEGAPISRISLYLTATLNCPAEALSEVPA